jgi:hypothetical protein
VVRPERFELPASWFVARRSIQLSYGRKDNQTPRCGSPELRLPHMHGSTLGRVRGANTTTSTADHHSIAKRRFRLNMDLEYLSMFNKINILHSSGLCSMNLVAEHGPVIFADILGDK